MDKKIIPNQTDPKTGLWVIYDIETGKPRNVHPVDAVEQVKLGVGTLEPPNSQSENEVVKEEEEKLPPPRRRRKVPAE